MSHTLSALGHSAYTLMLILTAARSSETFPESSGSCSQNTRHAQRPTWNVRSKSVQAQANDQTSAIATRKFHADAWSQPCTVRPDATEAEIDEMVNSGSGSIFQQEILQVCA